MKKSKSPKGGKKSPEKNTNNERHWEKDRVTQKDIDSLDFSRGRHTAPA